MLEEPDLTPAERALCKAAAAGRLLDRRTRRPGEDNPARGRAWGNDRQIRAQLLRQLLTGQGCLDQTFGAPLAVRLQGAQITGRLNLGGLTLRCPLALHDCFLGGRLDLAKAKAPDISLRGSYLCQRLSARRLRLDYNLNLSEGFHCYGPVKLLGAHIGGELNCEQATFTNPNGWALSADGLVVDGGLSLRGAQVAGEVRLPFAHIGVQVACNRATFSNRNGWALNADGLVVDGGLSLSSAQVTGEVRLPGARIDGQLDCDGVTLVNPLRTAFNADGLVVTGNLLLSSAQVTGEVRLAGARITGQLACNQAMLTNPKRIFTNPEGRAFTADRLVLDGGLFLSGAQVTGEVRLAGANIGGQFACEGTRFISPGALALLLQETSVKGGVVMRPARLEGGIDLTAARVGGWYDDKQTWPAILLLQGFVYETIEAAPTITPRHRVDWLHLHKDANGRTIYLPQPYEQLAAVYRRAGDHEGARTVAIAKQQARRTQVSNRWARWPSRAWSRFLRWTIGYGYQPALALPWLVGLFAVGWFVFDYAHPTHLSPARKGQGQPGFHAARYTLDLLLPVANLKQRDAFVPHGYAAWWAFGLSLAGWLLAAVVVAGLTGVFKRD